MNERYHGNLKRLRDIRDKGHDVAVSELFKKVVMTCMNIRPGDFNLIKTKFFRKGVTSNG